VPPLSDWLWGALFALQLAASAAVTLHVLLRRPPPASAAAWIGLAWLAPFAGPALYAALGVNRIERRALRLHRRQMAAPGQPACSAIRPAHLVPLGRAAARLTARPLLAGNEVTALEHGDEAYPAMLAAIRAAGRSVALASYIFENDAVGREFIAALAAARARGVEVRVLIDGVGGGWLHCAAGRALRREGVACARFLHSLRPWRMPVLNLRNHKKLLIVDGSTGFTGGLNIGAEYLDAPAIPRRRPMRLPRIPRLRRRRRAIRDTHFRLRGPVVAQMMAAFADDWHFAAGETLAGETWFPPDAPAPSCAGAMARVATSGPDHDLERIKLLVMSAIGAAARRVRIVTPYFLPDEALSTALVLAALRGVRVEIIVPPQTDHPLVDWAMPDGLAALALAGCEVHWTEPPFDHSKLMTVDGEWSLVGSANMDMRSLRLNFELNVELLDPAATAMVDAMIDATPRHRATAQELFGRSVLRRLRDGTARLLLPYL
jgi:cardiolipin synthase